MKRGPPGPPKGRIRNTPRREQQLDQALANSSPASDPPAMVGPGRSEVLSREDDA